jgi:hypothetical protein
MALMASSSIAVGDSVRLHSLKRVELNERRGVVVRVPSNGTMVVRLDDDNEQVTVTTAHLEVLDVQCCWGCGAKPPEGQRFQECSKCHQLQIVPAKFCSQACLAKNWPRHKAWHKEQKRLHLPAVNPCDTEKMTKDHDPYAQIVGKDFIKLGISQRLPRNSN